MLDSEESVVSHMLTNEMSADFGLPAKGVCRSCSAGY